MKILAAGWVACLLLVQDPPSRKPPVSVRIDTLFNYGADERWHTIILEVTNQTATEQDFLIGVGMGGNDRAERRERFAPRVCKRLFFYLPSSFYGYRVQVAVDDASGRRVLDETREISLSGRQGSSGPRLLAALMAQPPVQMSTDYFPQVIAEELFPDRWIGLEGVSLVILRDYRLDILLPAQRAALLEWVRRGGRVILYPGSNRDWLTSPGVQELAPMTLGASEEVETLLELEADFSPFRERTKFVRHPILNGRPLREGLGGAVYFPCGRGAVVVVPFDLERAPFDSWPGAQDYRRVLASVMPTDLVPDGANEPRRTDMPRLSTASAFIHRASTATVNRLPPFGILAGLTLVYLIVIGPVNFLVLRRLRMTVRLVFTIPAISAVFLGVVILTGYVLRGASTVVYEVSVLEAPSGAGLAIENHYLSLFSPTARAYDIAFGADETGSPGEDLEDDDASRYGRGYAYRGGRGPRYSDNPFSKGVVYDQTDRWTLKGVSFQQWQTRGFVGNAIRSMDGGVEFKIGSDLQVTNRSPYTIRRGWAVAWSPVYQAVEFGDVPQGETRRFPLNWVHGVDRRYAWEEAESLEERLVGGWLFECSRNPFARPFLLCVLDRLPDEISVDARRSGRSDRLCLLQVGGGP